MEIINIKFHETPSSGSKDFPCGRTDRHDTPKDDFRNFPLAYRNFHANSPRPLCARKVTQRSPKTASVPELVTSQFCSVFLQIDRADNAVQTCLNSKCYNTSTTSCISSRWPISPCATRYADGHLLNFALWKKICSFPRNTLCTTTYWRLQVQSKSNLL